MSSMLLLVGPWAYHSDDRHLIQLDEQHRPLLNKVWEDPELAKQIGELLIESADVNQHYLGRRFLEYAKRNK
jgi:hypothetical protein